jgi:hypothetical protein
MARPGVHIHLGVVMRPLVLVQDHHRNRCAKGVSELRAGVDLDAVLLITRSRKRALAGTATGKLRLDVGLR